ncbi:MAG: methionyl-tRNA formyltransferase [Burkholderiaceae bacterium]
MRLAFAGTPAFAARALEALIASRHQVELVLTQPDRPAGRGKRMRASAVKTVALHHGLPVFQPTSLKDPNTWEPIRQSGLDAMIVAAYGLILPEGLLGLPAYGCLNIHASLLPRWRGAAPIQRAIEAGDTASGVCIMQMEAGLDTGPVWLEKTCRIGPDDSGGQLLETLTKLGALAIIEALDGLESDALIATAQPEAGVSYAHKITPAERALDFTKPAKVLHDRIRAFDPSPGTTVSLATPDAAPIKVWRSALIPADELRSRHLTGSPGRVLLGDRSQLIVACGDDAGLQLLEVQRPGGKRIPIEAFQQAQAPIVTGQQFGIAGQ